MCNNMNMVVYTGRCHASFDWDVYIKMKRGRSKHYIGTNKMGRPNKKVFCASQGLHTKICDHARENLPLVGNIVRDIGFNGPDGLVFSLIRCGYHSRTLPPTF